MHTLQRIFHNNKVFIPYITAGDPDLETTKTLISALEEAGADAIELGVPFTDPIADGPVIQKAHIRALTSQTTLAKIIYLVHEIRQYSTIPLLFMMSYNAIKQYDEKKFVTDIKAAGLNGVIVPDLPFEESAGLSEKLRSADISLISFVAPTTSDSRLKKIARNAQGFIYLISSTGVTGERNTVSSKIESLVKKIKQYTDVPVAIGFGISNSQMAREISQLADGIIVGSAIVKIIEEHKTSSREPVYTFAKNIKNAIKAEDHVEARN